jgi:hypothetical protein
MDPDIQYESFSDLTQVLHQSLQSHSLLEHQFMSPRHFSFQRGLEHRNESTTHKITLKSYVQHLIEWRHETCLAIWGKPFQQYFVAQFLRIELQNLMYT